MLNASSRVLALCAALIFRLPCRNFFQLSTFSFAPARNHQAARDLSRLTLALEQQRRALQTSQWCLENIQTGRLDTWCAERAALEAALAHAQKAFEGERRIKESLQTRLGGSESTVRVRHWVEGGVRG